MKKYILLEIIPTKFKDGDIIQLSALKLEGLNLIDRFDYRLKEDKIILPKLCELIDYDKDKFIYKESKEEIMNDFKNWIEDYPLLILNNKYTENYLLELKNEIKYIEEYLDLEYSDEIIDKIKEKYNLEDSNYIVDLLYEALIYENK